MESILSNRRVRLVEELTELQLPEGEVGVVRNSWHYPHSAYEVEFHSRGQALRVLLLDHQVAATADD